VPEYPDIVVYIEALEKRIQGQTLERVRLGSPFLLRTAAPPLSTVDGRKVAQLRRLGKRICVGFEGDLWLVLHLMIAGRLHWKELQPSKNAPARLKVPRTHLAAFEFDNGTLSLTEAGTQRRASLHLLASEAELELLNPGGLEIFGAPSKEVQKASPVSASLEEFSAVLQSTNHTLKRALTDPRLLSGIGNAYSDEILFNARLSPIKLTQKLSAEELERLYLATCSTLTEWVERLRAETGSGFPEKVTAFRAEMAVHGRYQQPCPRCGAKIQRIRYATNETNYCPVCQTGGKLLADRALSRILREDWPKTAEELG
jgi:formamidopyrimidine-DNA glycosylase